MRLATIADMLTSGDVTALRGIPGLNGGRGQQFLRQFDKDGDGKLDEAERTALMEFPPRHPAVTGKEKSLEKSVERPTARLGG